MNRMVCNKIGTSLITLLALLLLAGGAGAVPSEEWNKTFGGTGFDYANSIQQTSDGGYVLAGQTYVSDVYAVWLIKTDANGNQQWNRTFGGRKTGVDSAGSVQQTRDGGYIIAGKKASVADYDVTWLIKTDSNGNEQWDKIFGGPYMWKNAHSVQQTSDGGYIIAGWIYREIYRDNYSYAAWLIKTNADGDEQWNRTFGGTQTDQDYANDVKQNSDGGYIIAGRTESTLNHSAWLIKVDANGNQQWKKTFGFPSLSMIGNPYDFKSVELVSDGGYIIAGWTIYGDGTSDAWLIKTDANGNLQWSKTFGGADSDYANAVIQTLDGGYILAGHTNSYGAGDMDAWLIKVGGATAETNTVTLPEKAAGFEAALAITILLVVHKAWRRRK